MAFGQTWRHLGGFLGLGAALGLAAGHATAQDRGDGQSSTRISEPLPQGGMQGLFPRDVTAPGTGLNPADPSQPAGFPATPDPGDYNQNLPGQIGGVPLPEGVDPDDLPPPGTPTPPGSSPLMPDESPLGGMSGILGGGADLTPGQRGALQRSQERLLPEARAIRDPSERSLALNRVARSKIASGRLDEASEALDEASQAARSMPRGLVRDLRLISVYRTYVEMAHDRIVEAVPTIAPASGALPLRGARSGMQVEGWLDLAAAEFARAAELVGEIDNANYRNEHLASIIEAQAIDSMKIINDASRSPESRLTTGRSAAELMAFADRLVTQATRQAATLDRAIWQDQAMVILVAAAARSNQFTRALSIARSLPRAEARAEALMQTADSMARLAAMFRVQFRDALERSWGDLAAGIESIQALAPPSELEAQDFGYSMTRQNLLDDVVFRAEGQAQIARALVLVADEIFIRLEQNETLSSGVPSPLDDPEGLLGDVRTLRDSSSSLVEALDDLRASLAGQRDQSTSLDPARQEPVVPAEPDEARFAAVRDQTEEIGRLLDRIAEPLDRAATPTYRESAQAVASIFEDDPRSNVAVLLIESLTAVGRFTDARHGTLLVPDEERRYVLLSQIAQSQGRRGLADSAREWIAREVPPQRRDPLYRSVQEGVLNSLDQMRSRTAGSLSR